MYSFPGSVCNSSAVTVYRIAGDARFAAQPARAVDGLNPIYGYKFRKQLREQPA